MKPQTYNIFIAISTDELSKSAYHTFSSADIQRLSMSKHRDSFSNLSKSLDTSVISSSTGFPGPLLCDK